MFPQEIADYFRFYPLKIERNAEFPVGREEDETIIETRGYFINRATPQQERDWYNQLISVFGKKELWDGLWSEMEGLSAPDGPLRGSGINPQGYLEFSFYEDWEADKNVLDELYQHLNEIDLENDIEELPVVFDGASY